MATAPAPSPAPEAHPATTELLASLDEIVESGPHEADPRVPAVTLAAALAKYFRSPD